VENHNNQEHKEFTLIVNTREKKWGEPQISYEQVVVLAFGSIAVDPDTVYTVTYSKGKDPHREGSLVKGGIVQVANGMIFNVTQTRKS